jgi:starch synthase
MKIAFCASEIVPFAKTGGLADVAGALPVALEKEGQEIVIIMPRYKSADIKKFGLKVCGNGVYLGILGKDIRVYFIDKKEYFYRDGLYGDKSGDYADNLERFSYYCRRSLELLKEINFKPDIIHCHDWQTSLIPVYLKTLYAQDKFFKNTRTLLTIHNIGYQGLFPKEEFGKLGLDWSIFSLEGVEFYGNINLLKGGIVFSDIINTVSQTYAKEIQTEEFGFGLQGLLNERRDKVFGILNGVDYDVWNPRTDKFISVNYSQDSFFNKEKNKIDLLSSCVLPIKKNTPLLGIVSRLAQQKGFDIIAKGMEEICRLGLQIIILGTGDLRYQQILTGLAAKYPESVSVNFRFDDPLAHKIYAGADIFLMPSRYEPCGLGQLISLRYGTVPVVFKTGGLADTVSSDNGFIFEDYSKEGLLKSIKDALSVYRHRDKWEALVKRAMQYDFSWESQAKKYVKLYAKAK